MLLKVVFPELSLPSYFFWEAKLPRSVYSYFLSFMISSIAAIMHSCRQYMSRKYHSSPFIASPLFALAALYAALTTSFYYVNSIGPSLLKLGKTTLLQNSEAICLKETLTMGAFSSRAWRMVWRRAMVLRRVESALLRDLRVQGQIFPNDYQDLVNSEKCFQQFQRLFCSQTFGRDSASFSNCQLFSHTRNVSPPHRHSFSPIPRTSQSTLPTRYSQLYSFFSNSFFSGRRGTITPLQFSSKSFCKAPKSEYLLWILIEFPQQLPQIRNWVYPPFYAAERTLKEQLDFVYIIKKLSQSTVDLLDCFSSAMLDFMNLFVSRRLLAVRLLLKSGQSIQAINYLNSFEQEPIKLRRCPIFQQSVQPRNSRASGSVKEAQQIIVSPRLKISDLFLLQSKRIDEKSSQLASYGDNRAMYFGFFIFL